MKKLFISALCLATFWSCANSEDTPPQAEAGNVYMQFSVKMETTRSATDGAGDTNSDASPDFEVGLDKENTISSVDIVLTNGTDYVVAKSVTDIASAAKDTYVASFSTLELKESTAYDVYIYANCNAPESKDLDATSDATIASMTADNGFWMTNAVKAVTVTLPADMSLYTQPQTPYNLGAHKVERSMARFDYMPINNNAYEIGESATVTLTEAALINQSKAFYMLRRVSEDGTNANWELGGVENLNNYVVDTDYQAKAAGYTEAQVANFDYHLTAPANWDWKSIAVADLTQKDNWEGTDDGKSGSSANHPLNDYYVWQYAKENTIPNIKAQEKGITTGVVFKGEITGEAVTAANGGMIYVFDNILYGTWDKVAAAATAANASATLTAAYNQVEASDKTADDYADAGFTGYSADDDDKYYAYYYYWNRHNDNGDNSKMGPMEFAVVRNNVYKLCVDKIARFGHPDPNNPENPDPDPVDPTDPDEELNYYFNVTVKVLPWVVRVNHIEF